MSKRIRKQCHELQFGDLDQYPAWEFASDEEGIAGQDETTVRPVEVPRGRRTAGVPIIVLAVLEFPSGRVRFGALTIGVGEDVASTQPSLFLPKGQLNFYLGACPPSRSELGRQVRQLRMISKDPFPIHYHTALRDKAGLPLASGVLKGFYRHGGFDRPAKRVAIA